MKFYKLVALQHFGIATSFTCVIVSNKCFALDTSEKTTMQTAKEKKEFRDQVRMQRQSILSDIKIPLRPTCDVGIVYKGEKYQPPEENPKKVRRSSRVWRIIMLFIMYRESLLNKVSHIGTSVRHG